MNAVKGKSVDLEYDFTGLNNFVKTIDRFGKYVVKVGIFGNKSARQGGGAMTNAEVGVINEFGSEGRRGAVHAFLRAAGIHEFGSFRGRVPARSFLRMPIAEKSKQIIADASKGAAEMLAKGDVVGVLKRLGIACEKQIQLAFATRGFGSWAPDAPSTVRKKGSNQPLIDTSQLRRSISSQVSEK